MKKLTRVFALALFAISLAFGQATFTSTTLSAAIDGTQTQFAVASATGVTSANGTNYVTWLLVDKEVMAVSSVSSTTVTVIRGYRGNAGAHVNSSKVWVGTPAYFAEQDPAPGGACTAANELVLPKVVWTTGNLWNCGNGQWATGGVFAGRLTVGAQLTAAATLTITNPIHHITSSATTVTTISANWLPATGGCISLIPDASMTGFTSSTGGNIALATTTVANKMLTLCLDPATAKWYPSY